MSDIAEMKLILLLLFAAVNVVSMILLFGNEWRKVSKSPEVFGENRASEK